MKKICFLFLLIQISVLNKISAQSEKTIIDYIGWELEIYNYIITNEIMNHEVTDAMIQKKKRDFNYTGRAGVDPLIDENQLNFFSRHYLRDPLKIIETPEFSSAILDQNVFNQLFPPEGADASGRETFTEKELKYIRENFLPKKESGSIIITGGDNYIPENIQDLMSTISHEQANQIIPDADNFIQSESGLLLPQQPSTAQPQLNFQLPPNQQLDFSQNQTPDLGDSRNNQLFDEQFSQLDPSQVEADQFKARIHNKLKHNFPMLSNQYKRRIMRFRHLDFELTEEFLRKNRIIPVLKDELIEEGLKLTFDRSTFEMIFDGEYNDQYELIHVPRSVEELKEVVKKVGRISSRVGQSMDSSGGDLASQFAGTHLHITFNKKVSIEEADALMHQLKLDIGLDIYDEYERKNIPEADRSMFKHYSKDILNKNSHIMKVNKGIGADRRYEIRELTKPYDQQIKYIENFFNADGSINKAKYNNLVQKNIQRAKNLKSFTDSLKALTVLKQQMPYLDKVPTKEIDDLAITTLDRLSLDESIPAETKFLNISKIIKLTPDVLNNKKFQVKLKSLNANIIKQIDFDSRSDIDLYNIHHYYKETLQTLSKHKKKLGFNSISDVRKTFNYYLKNYLNWSASRPAFEKIGIYLNLINLDLGSKKNLVDKLVSILNSDMTSIEKYLKSLDNDKLKGLGMSFSDVNSILENYDNFRAQFPEETKKIIDKIILNEALVVTNESKEELDLYRLAQNKINGKVKVNQRENLILKLSKGIEYYKKSLTNTKENDSLINALIKYHDDPNISHLFARSLLIFKSGDRQNFLAFFKKNEEYIKEKLGIDAKEFTKQKLKDYVQIELEDIGKNLNHTNSAHRFKDLLDSISTINTNFPEPHNIVINQILNHFSSGQYKKLMERIHHSPDLKSKVITFFMLNANHDQRVKFAQAYVNQFGLEDAFLKTTNEFFHTILLSSDKFKIQPFLNPEHPSYIRFIKKVNSIPPYAPIRLFKQHPKIKDRVIKLMLKIDDMYFSAFNNKQSLTKKFKSEYKKAKTADQKILILQKYVEDLENQGYRLSDYIKEIMAVAKFTNTESSIDKALLEIIRENILKIKSPIKRLRLFIKNTSYSRETSTGLLFDYPKESYLSQEITKLFFNQPDADFYLLGLHRNVIPSISFDSRLVNQANKKASIMITEVFGSGDLKQVEKLMDTMSGLDNYHIVMPVKFSSTDNREFVSNQRF